ncbi:MAG TPA: di-heme oxidoredictase family protein [Kofleriaceae bacterium]
MTRSRWIMLALFAGCARGDHGDNPPDAGPSITGACADGFVRCDKLCIEDSLVGPACAPKICERGPGGSPMPAQVGARGIAHRLDFLAGSAHLAVTTGVASAPLTPTLSVEVHYRRNGGPVEHATLTGAGTAWQVDIPGSAGDVLDYYFTQKVGPNTFHPGSPHTEPSIDSAWFRRVLGAPPPSPPAYPLRVEIGARFRDRHRNEWRYDHYVQGYDAGAAYTLTLVDRGNALDVTVVPDPEAKVGKIDLKWYDTFGPTPFCNDPPALAGLAAPGSGMLRNGNTFTYTIPDVVEGQLVDLELTLTDLIGPVLTYYSEWFYYRIGTGKLGRRDQDPHAYAAGDAAVSDITVHQFAYAQHVPNASAETLADFLAGKLIFDTALDSGMLVNPPTTFDCRGTQPLTFPPAASPIADTLRPALGPQYDAVSCTGCHRLDGRGAPPESASEPATSIVVLLSPAHPIYGGQLSRHAVGGGAPEAELRVAWQEQAGAFDDGTPFSLRRPQWSFQNLSAGPLDELAVSVRIAPPVFGLGLVEAVPDATILGLADPDDADHDGISGRPSIVVDRKTGLDRLGRFGWTAAQPTIEQQIAAAFAGDMGVGSSIYSDPGTEISDDILTHATAYIRALSVPPRTEHRDPSALRGKALFEAAHCTGCHVPSLVTAQDAKPHELAGQVIQPFSDFLLHDLGEGLADGHGREWRTTPLWGLGFADHALGDAATPTDPNRRTGVARYLHDGRARTLMEAILWHGGEAEAARKAVLALTAAQRDDLVSYLRYPFADPPLIGCP